MTGLVLGYVSLAIFCLFNAFAIHDVFTIRIAENEYSAVSSIRSIVVAERTAGTLDPSSAPQCDLSGLGKLGLIDDATARGEKGGYRFKLACAKPSGAGVLGPPLHI